MSNIQRKYEVYKQNIQSDGVEEDFGELGETKDMRIATLPKFDMGNGYSSIFTRPLTPTEGIIPTEDHDIQI